MGQMNTEDLQIVEKYDQAVNYLYPIVQRIPRAHGVFRQRLLEALVGLPAQLYAAAQTDQISRVRLVDASLAEIRWLLRFAAHRDRKLITQGNQETALILLAEVGGMINKWETRLNPRDPSRAKGKREAPG